MKGPNKGELEGDQKRESKKGREQAKLPCMDFLKVLQQLDKAMSRDGIRYALVGGFALAMRGVQRATADLDFLLLSQDLDRAHEILTALGYQRVFHSENVSHYRSETDAFGRINILHAFRSPSLSMLDRAEALAISPGLNIPVLQTEDLIGLKIQAAVNDPERADEDWLDIRLLLQAAKRQGRAPDWELIADYLAIFDKQHERQTLEAWYDQAE